MHVPNTRIRLTQLRYCTVPALEMRHSVYLNAALQRQPLGAALSGEFLRIINHTNCSYDNSSRFTVLTSGLKRNEYTCKPGEIPIQSLTLGAQECQSRLGNRNHHV